MPRITYQKKQNDAVSVQSLVLIFLANPMHLEVLFYICLNSLCVGLHLLSISDILCFFTLHDVTYCQKPSKQGAMKIDLF